jgi:catechol-2,3-dioxygenase
MIRSLGNKLRMREAPVMSARIGRLGHAVLYVASLERSLPWYQNILGMTLVTEEPSFGAAFLSFGSRDHDIALFENKQMAGADAREYNHLAFELDGELEDLRAFRRKLLAAAVPIAATVDHGISYGIYFPDPDGHLLEVFCQRPHSAESDIAYFQQVGVKSKSVDLDRVQP